MIAEVDVAYLDGTFFDEGEITFTGTQKIQAGPLREAAEARLRAERAHVAGHRYGADT